MPNVIVKYASNYEGLSELVGPFRHVLPLSDRAQYLCLPSPLFVAWVSPNLQIVAYWTDLRSDMLLCAIPDSVHVRPEDSARDH